MGRVLQNGFDNVEDTPIDDMICKPGYSYTTHGYMLSKSGIKKIVENHLPKYKSMMFVVDEFLPSLYCETPRTELNDIFTKDINAYDIQSRMWTRDVRHKKDDIRHNAYIHTTKRRHSI